MVVYLFIVSSTNVTAQSYSVARNYKQAADVSASGFESSTAGSSFHSLNVSERVSKKFIKAFPGINKAIWVNKGNGFVVRFTSNDIQN